MRMKIFQVGRRKCTSNVRVLLYTDVYKKVHTEAQIHGEHMKSLKKNYAKWILILLPYPFCITSRKALLIRV